MTDKPQSNFAFRMMSWAFQIRDIFSSPINILKEAEIKPGFIVLDYGCGPGSYALAAAEMVGSSGKVYALDIHPLAVHRVQKVASKKGLRNIETIHSDCATGLPDENVDVVLLFDILHELSEPDKILEELYRILKPDGTLSFSDHHLKEDEIVSKITHTGLFRLEKKTTKTYRFIKTQ